MPFAFLVFSHWQVANQLSIQFFVYLVTFVYIVEYVAE